MLRDLIRSLPVASELARRNVATQYRQSLLGVLQAFFPAIVTTVWCVMIRRAQIINVESLDIPYPAFVLISMMLWLTFVESLQAPIDALVAEQALLRNSPMPREAVVFGSIGVVGFNFLVKLILIIAAILWYRIPIAPTVLLAPLGVLCLMCLGVGLGLILAPLNFLYRDISRSLGAIVMFWFFLTPILFPVPDTPPLGWIVRLNPVTPLLVSTREWVTLGTTSQVTGLLVVLPLTCLICTAGWMFYRVATPIVLERGN